VHAKVQCAENKQNDNKFVSGFTVEVTQAETEPHLIPEDVNEGSIDEEVC